MPRVTMAEWLPFTDAVLDRLIEDAGDAPARWQQLAEKLPDLQPEQRRKVRTQLEQRVAEGHLDSEGRTELWEALRDMAAKYRTYSDAGWALPDTELGELETVAAALQPSGDPLASHAWLFASQMPDLGVPGEREDYQAYSEHLTAQRTEAVARVEQVGFSAVQALAALAADPGDVGLALADASSDKYRDALSRLISSENRVDAGLAWGWLVRRIQSQGWPWVDAVLVAGLSPEQKAQVLLATREYPRSWEKAEELGVEVATAYWRRFNPQGLGTDFSNVKIAATGLGKIGRVAAALRLAVIYAPRSGEKHTSLLISVLRDFLDRGEADPESVGIRDYDFRLAFDHLHKNASPEQFNEIAQLEWMFLPALGLDPKIDALQAALAADPDFFSEILNTVYRADPVGDESDDDQVEQQQPTPTPEEVQLATNGYQLLRAFDRLPGLQTDGTVDGDALRHWVARVLEMAEKSGRGEIAELEVGHVLAHSPKDLDGGWPCEAVRNLLEVLQSARVESGLQVEVVNRRGVTTRGLEEGGKQETELAEEYRATASRFADAWPQTAAVLRSLAGSFDADARREEGAAERFRRGLER